MKTDVILNEKEVAIQGDLALTNSKFYVRRGSDSCTINANSIHIKEDTGTPVISLSNNRERSSFTAGYLATPRVNAKKTTSDKLVAKDVQIYGLDNEVMVPGKITFKGPGNKVLLEIDPSKQDIIFEDGSTLSSKLNTPSTSLIGANTNSLNSDTITFKSGANPLIEMFPSGTNNPDTMVIAHSKNHKKWGLMYRDANDSFHFNRNGKSVMAIGLGQNKVGIHTEDPQYDLHVTGTIASTKPIQTLSDGQYKRDVQTIHNAVNTIQHLHGVDFKWNDKMKLENEGPDKKQYGFIAQELEEVIPELVHTASNGDKTVNYQGVIPFLVQAIKEQQEQIETLKSQIKN